MKFISSAFLTVPLCLVSSSSAFVVTTNKEGVSLSSLFGPAPAMHPLVGGVLPPVPAAASRKQMIRSTTALPMGASVLPEGNPQDEIYRLVDELAWEGVDLDKAKKLLETEILKPPHTLGEDMAIAAIELQDEEISMKVFDPCAEALFDVTVDLIGLVLAIVGVPGKIGKKVAKTLAKKAGKKLNKEVRRIIKDYFQNASDLIKVSQGVWEFLQALLSIFNPGSLITAIFAEMTWWEVGLYSATITAQVALLFAASAPGIVVKLALVTPSIIDVVASAVKVSQKCD
jgi:hypothetical protein